ncbi:hypothetical protein Dimus_039511 [Dionaea muscipula]
MLDMSIAIILSSSLFSSIFFKSSITLIFLSFSCILFFAFSEKFLLNSSIKLQTRTLPGSPTLLFLRDALSAFLPIGLLLLGDSTLSLVPPLLSPISSVLPPVSCVLGDISSILS